MIKRGHYLYPIQRRVGKMMFGAVAMYRITAGWFGAISPVLIGGASTIFIVLLWMTLFPALINRERLTTDWRFPVFPADGHGFRLVQIQNAP